MTQRRIGLRWDYPRYARLEGSPGSLIRRAKTGGAGRPYAGLPPFSESIPQVFLEAFAAPLPLGPTRSFAVETSGSGPQLNNLLLQLGVLLFKTAG